MQDERGWRTGRGVAIVLVVLIALLIGLASGFAQPVLAVETAGIESTSGDATVEEAAVDMTNGAQVFSLNCAGCHINGGNIVRRGKNLKLKALQRYKFDSIEAIAQIVTNGKGIMSAYGDRLTPQEIQAVATYVLQQAEQGWKQEE